MEITCLSFTETFLTKYLSILRYLVHSNDFNCFCNLDQMNASSRVPLNELFTQNKPRQAKNRMSLTKLHLSTVSLYMLIWFPRHTTENY